MTYAITVHIHRPPLTTNDSRGMHWSKVRKLKTEMENRIGWAAKAQLPYGLRLDKVRVHVTWYAPDNRTRRDSDSLGPWLKAGLDVLVKCGYLRDDSHKYVVSSGQSIVVDPLNPRIVMTLEPVE